VDSSTPKQPATTKESNMTRIKVTPDLAGASPQIYGHAATFGENLHVLRGQVTALQDSWNSVAGRAQYDQYTNEWDVSAKGLLGDGSPGSGVLPSIADVMAKVAANYEECESTNFQTWKH
jgi:hypothetical protein